MSETIGYEELMEQYAEETRAMIRVLKREQQEKYKAKPLRYRARHQWWRLRSIYVVWPWEHFRARLADWVYPYGDGKYE